MAFTPIRYDEGKVMSLPAVGSNTAITKGNALKNSSGYLTNAAAGDNTDVEFVAMETVTTGSSNGDTLVKVIPVRGVHFLVDTSNTATQAQMLTQVDLGAAGSVDTSATTDQVFYAAKLVSSSKVEGWFVGGVPNS